MESSFGQFKFHLLGENNQTTVILIGGGPGFSSWNLQPIQFHLAENNFRVLLADPFGVGENANIKADSWLKAWLEQIKQLGLYKNDSKVILIGHSWGALLAMLYSQNYPHSVTELILINPVEPDKQSINHLVEQLDYKKRQLTSSAQVLEQDWDNQIESQGVDEKYLAQKQISEVLPLYFADIELGRRYSRQFNSDDFKVAVNIKAWQEYDQNPLSYQTFRELRIPIKIIGCDGDLLMTYNLKSFQANLNLAALTILNNCNHFPWVEQPDNFNNALIKALQQKQSKSNH